MLHSALPATIRERLLSEAVRRHELSVRAVPGIEDLLRHGLSLEQAVVGTGLITPQQFSDWMQRATSLPLLTPTTQDQALPPGLEQETILAWQVVPQKVSAKKWLVGLTNPWDQDVRSAVEALAVEQGWSVDFAYVIPSVADVWLCSLGQKQRLSDTLRRYARSLMERVEREKALTLVHAPGTAHPEDNVATVPVSWLPALHLRLKRRAVGSRMQVHHHRHHHHAKIDLAFRGPAEVAIREAEHPMKDWTDGFRTCLDQGKLVFVLDERGDLFEQWPQMHVPHQLADEWRAGKRWLTASSGDPDEQEELFHLALAGYPGTVCFQSKHELQAWEQAADAAQVEYAACIGHQTDDGVAWSLYSV